MSELDESDIQKIHKSAVENTMAEYSSVVQGVNINTLQAESKKALGRYDYSCANCGSQGILEGEEEILLTLERPESNFDTKEEAVNSSNLIPLCRDCFDQAEGEAVSSAEQSKNSSERLQYTVQGFEKLVAENTPTLIIRQSFRYLFAMMLLFVIGSVGYGIYDENYTATSFLTSILEQLNTIITTIFIDYTLLTFILVIPIIGIYTLFEHYQPDEYAKEQYVKSWKFGGISIPYIFHPIFVLLTSGFVVVGGYLGGIGVIAQDSFVGQLLPFALLVLLVLLVTFPRTFRKVIRADKSEIMARSQLAQASEKVVLDKYTDIIVTANQTTKPHLTESYIREYYDDYDRDFGGMPDLSGEYYSPLLWIWLCNIMISYIILVFAYTIISGITISPLIELALFSSPTILVLLYIVYRRRKFSEISSKIDNLEEKIESETSIGGE